MTNAKPESAHGTGIDALQRAAEILGSASALAGHIGVTKGAVSQWKDPHRKIPAEYCPMIERLTEGKVRCEDLRPDVDWAYLRIPAETCEHSPPP